MKKISNREDGNQYYEMVNKCIDEYIDHKIKPSNLRNYFRNTSKLESFIKKYKLDEIDGIKKVISDVIEDRYAAEKDGIMKFENFILNEDLGKVDIKESGVSYEKILADLYHTSVGHVSIVDEKEHKYTINDFGVEKNVIIYSRGDIEDFKKSVIPILLDKSKKEVIDLYKVDLGLSSGKEIKFGISISIEEILSEDKLNRVILNKLDEKKLDEIITNFINDYDILKSKKIYKYFKEFKDSHIWELNNR